MEPRIIYKDQNGNLCVIIPFLGCGLTVEQIAAKDVPAGAPYKIVDASEIPADRSQRHLWDVDEVDLTDGIGADYGAGSASAVVGWDGDGNPIIVEVSQ